MLLDQNLTLLFFFAAILVFAGLLFAVIALTRRGPKGLNVEWYRTHWLSIEQKLTHDDTSSHHLVVLEADKLLDKALTDAGYSGKTMAERMKAANNRFSHVDSVWKAHKLRNHLAHEPGATASYDQARHALAAFKQALKNVGAI